METATRFVVAGCNLEAEAALHLGLVANHVRETPRNQDHVMNLSALLMESSQPGGPMESAASNVVVESKLGIELVFHLDLGANHMRETPRNQEHAMSKSAMWMESSQLGDPMESVAKNAVVELNFGIELASHLDLVANHVRETPRKKRHAIRRNALLMESLHPSDHMASAAKNVVVELSLDEEPASNLNLVANHVRGKLCKHGSATKHLVL